MTEPVLGHTCPDHALLQDELDHIWPEPYAGPMVELDGTRRLPDFFVPYVSFIVLASILTPLAGLGYLVWEGHADLGISTLGVYVLCLVVQVASESVCLRLGEPPCSNTYHDSVCSPDPGHPGLGGWGMGIILYCVQIMCRSPGVGKVDGIGRNCFGRAMLRHLLLVVWLSTCCGCINQSEAFFE